MRGIHTTPVVCRVSSGDPESSTFHIRLGSLQKTLHITTVDTNILHQSLRAEVLQTIYLSFTNHKFLPSQTK